MKMFAILVMLALAAPLMAAEEATPKLTLELRDAPLSQALESMTRQTGVPVIAGANTRCILNLSLEDITLERAISTIASVNNFQWQKLDFAVSQDTPLAADEIAKAIAAIKAVSVMGIVVSDKEQKTQTLFGKGLPSAAPPALPEGYRWQTVYLIQKPEEKQKTAGDTQLTEDDVEAAKQHIDLLNEERLDLLMSLSPEDRQMLAQDEFHRMLAVAPELRRDMLRGWASAVTTMDPETRRYFASEMRDNLSDMFPRGQ